MTIDAQTGRIDWTPDAIGSHTVRVRFSDGLMWTEQSWTLQVKDAPLTAIIDPGTALLSPNAPHAIRIVPSDAASQVHVGLILVEYALVLHAWDAAGNQTKATRFPDGTSEITAYDEENRVAGRIRRHSACFFGASQRSMRCCASRTKSVKRVAAPARR